MPDWFKFKVHLRVEAITLLTPLRPLAFYCLFSPALPLAFSLALSFENPSGVGEAVAVAEGTMRLVGFVPGVGVTVFVGSIVIGVPSPRL
jgi:hypothetical protein